MNNMELLDNILLGEDVVNSFYNHWKNNADFKNWIDKILPEVELCENQQQNNPWHKYNVLGHILHSVEAMNFQSKDLPLDSRRLLAYTMFMHDIAKPLHHLTRMKKGELIDSFFNHNIGSEKIARRVLPQLGFDEKHTDVICKLVLKHDIFMFIKPYPTENPNWKVLSPQLIQEEINDLNSVGNGHTLMQYLVMVGRADNLAQNEKMTSESLKLLDMIDNELKKEML